jgi:hypothetical protein
MKSLIPSLMLGLTAFSLPVFANDSIHQCNESSCSSTQEIGGDNSTVFKLTCEAPYPEVDTSYKNESNSGWVSCGSANKENSSAMNIKCVNWYWEKRDAKIDWKCKASQDDPGSSPDGEFIAD